MRRLHVKIRHRLKRLIAAAMPWSTLGAHYRSGDPTRRPAHALDAADMLDDAERAMRRGNLVGAAMALAQAQRTAPDTERTIELEARLALLRGRPDQAVERLDRAPRPGDRRRLLLALARCQAGDVARAHLDLAAWSRDIGCPPEARVLLAKLEIEAGDEEAARTALCRHRNQPDDALTCQMLVLLDTAEDLPFAAQHAASLLASAFADGGCAGLNGRWLASLGLTPRTVRIEPTHQQVTQLARSLAQEPGVIASLVRAQKIEPNPAQLRLLRRSLVRIADSLPEPRAGFEALAELAEIDGDRTDAARWARRVLRDDAFAASMALLLDRVTDDKTNRTTDALERARSRHPHYTDVQLALIDRYRRAGRIDDARTAAAAWVRSDPDNPAALAKRKELAA